MHGDVLCSSSCRSCASRHSLKAVRSRPRRRSAGAANSPTAESSLDRLPGEKGTWNGVDNRMPIPEKPEEVGDRDDGRQVSATGPAAFPKPKMSQVPFQPWARALYIFRTQHEFEPYTRCKPAGGVRMVATAYGTDFIDVPEQKRIYITQTGGPHSFRPIFMDGRPHPKDLDPSYYGHSVGHWEGRYAGHRHDRVQRTILDRPSRACRPPEQLHLTERITRPDFNTLRYEMTIDDPGAYTAPWTTGMFFRWAAGAEQFEFVCQDGNLAPLLMIGGREREGRSHAAAIAP